MTAAARKTVSAISLAVGAVVVVVMAIWGVNAFTAPIEDDDSPSVSDDELACPAGEEQRIIDFVRRSEVTVSVYNAGKKAGRARTTLDTLEEAGFKPGAIGNAPEGTDVPRAEVHTKTADRSEAQLVALALGRNTQVVVDEEQDLGPGVDVYIGDKFKRLDPKAPNRVTLDEPRVECG